MRFLAFYYLRIVDPRVKEQLNFVSENPVPEDQALKTLQSALRMQGFALVQDHGVLKVMPEADAKLQGVPTYVGNAPTARGDQVITQVFELHNESVNNVLPVLRPLISPNNTIAAYPANNTLVVADYADNARRIASIIADIDTAVGRQVKMVPLKNANALDVAEQFNKLLDPGSIGSTDATRLAKTLRAIMGKGGSDSSSSSSSSGSNPMAGGGQSKDSGFGNNNDSSSSD